MLNSLDIKTVISSIAIVVSVLIAVIGWYYNSRQNRKHEIFKRSIDARIKLLEDYLLFIFKATKYKSLDGFNKIQFRFYLYGNADEIKLVKKIASEIEKNKQINSEIMSNIIKLNKIARDRLRKELGLPKIDI